MGSFEQWKNFLARGVQTAQQAGASRASITEVAQKFGNYLAQHVDAANPQQRLLKELWEKGSPQEQEALASMITKMVSDGQRH